MSEQGSAPAGASTGAESTAASAPEASEAKPAASGAPAAASAPEVHEVTIAGQRKQVQAEQVRRALGLDPTDAITPAILKAYSKDVVASQRFSEADKVQKTIAALTQKLGQDPVAAIMEHFGVSEEDAEGFLLDHLGARVKRKSMPEDERKRLDEDAEIRRKAKERDELVAEREKQEREAQVAQQTQALGKRFGEILTKHGMQPTPARIGRMAGLIEGYLAEGASPSEEDVIAALRGEVDAERDEWLESLDLDALAKNPKGEAFLRKLRQADAARLKSTLGTKPAAKAPGEAPRSNGERPRPKSTGAVLDELLARRR